MIDLCSGQLKLYSSIKETDVDWLWYPYIPFGKITVIQGDPGCGKSTLMMDVIASVSTGKSAPDGRRIKKPMHVIYQCSEDSPGDTIKPRLVAAGADCSNIAFLDEERDPVTLCNETLRRAIADFNAKLLVIDPIQAYLGDADIANATGMRRILKQLAEWASLYECAIVLIGHLNKRHSSRDLYRSLGSIDIVAAARSVMYVERMHDDTVSVVRHVKSSLSSKGKDLFFTVDSGRRIEWINQESIDSENMNDSSEYFARQNKQEQAANLLKVILADGPIKASEVQGLFRDEDISERTILITKKALGIHSVRKDGVWYWQMPDRIK